MKICKIIDEYRHGLLIGYLFYYEKEKVFSIELNDRLEYADTPIFFDYYIQNKLFTVEPEWSRRWAQSRIPPSDRQNIRSILKDNRLKEYDVYRLLMVAEGRCPQDECAVMPVKYESLPDWVLERRRRKLEFAAKLNNSDMLLVFRDGSIFRTDLRQLARHNDQLKSALNAPAFMNEYRVMAGGVGLMIGGSLVLTAEELYGQGKELPITAEELRTVAGAYVMDTREVCSEMECTRQYVDQLTKNRGLSVLKDGGTRIYARSDVRKVTE